MTSHDVVSTIHQSLIAGAVLVAPAIDVPWTMVLK